MIPNCRLDSLFGTRAIATRARWQTSVPCRRIVYRPADPSHDVLLLCPSSSRSDSVFDSSPGGLVSLEPTVHIQSALAQLPDGDRLRTFDAYQARLLALPAAIAAASPARREELCRILVEQVVVNDRNVDEIVWTPPARRSSRRRPPSVGGSTPKRA